jgi:hypothetical protein
MRLYQFLELKFEKLFGVSYTAPRLKRWKTLENLSSEIFIMFPLKIRMV